MIFFIKFTFILFSWVNIGFVVLVCVVFWFSVFCVSILVRGYCWYSSRLTCPHISNISKTNQPFLKIILAWSASVWLVLNFGDSVLSFSLPSLGRIALKIVMKYIFVLFSSPLVPWVCLDWAAALVVCESKVKRMLSGSSVLATTRRSPVYHDLFTSQFGKKTHVGLSAAEKGGANFFSIFFLLFFLCFSWFSMLEGVGQGTQSFCVSPLFLLLFKFIEVSITSGCSPRWSSPPPFLFWHFWEWWRLSGCGVSCFRGFLGSFVVAFVVAAFVSSGGFIAGDVTWELDFFFLVTRVDPFYGLSG